MRRAGLIAALAWLAATAAAAAPAVTLLEVKPSAADPAVRNFDDPSMVLSPAGSTGQTPLVLFLTGTGGKPRGPLEFLKVVASQGYRVIGLEYNDEPAVAQVCRRSPIPAARRRSAGCASTARDRRAPFPIRWRSRSRLG